MSFLDDFVGYLQTRTDAPSDFHVHAGMVALSTAVGNRVWTHGWTRPVYPNLWAVVIAPSGYGKSAPLDMAERVLRKAQIDDRVLPTSFSYEALLRALKQQPVGTFVVQEFANFVAMLSRDYNAGARELLSEIYDCPERTKRITMAGEVVIEKPCLSILGASSPTWFAESLRGRSPEGGFLERIIFCPSTRTGQPIDDPGPPDDGVEAGLADHLRRAMALGGLADFSAVAASFSAWQRDQRSALRSAGPLEFGGMRSRAPLMVKKAAMLLRLSRDPTGLRIAPVDLDAAIVYVEQAQAQAIDFLANEVATTPDEADRIKVMAAVRRAGGRQDWSTALRLSRLTAFKFRNCVDTLEQSGRLQVTQGVGENGRKVKWLVVAARIPEFTEFTGSFREVGNSNGSLTLSAAARAGPRGSRRREPS